MKNKNKDISLSYIIKEIEKLSAKGYTVGQIFEILRHYRKRITDRDLYELPNDQLLIGLKSFELFGEEDKNKKYWISND